MALACAAEHPDSVTEVIAFSPTLLRPGSDPEHSASDRQVAELLAHRATLADMAGDPRNQALSSERLETRLVPVMRTYDAILSADSRALLDRVRVPVRFVVPLGDAITPRTFLAEEAASHSGFSLFEPPGDRLLPMSDPPAGVRVIDPDRDDEVSAARAEEPVKPPKSSRLTGYLSTITWLLLLRGGLALLGGLTLLFASTIPPRLVTTALAVWLLVEALQTIAGAFGLRRQGKAWLPWFLVGVVSGGFALFLTASEALAVRIAAVYVAVWAIARGTADLYVASRVRRMPGPRWLLVAQGVLGVLVGVLLLLVPELGARLLRYTLGGMLTVSGSLTLAYAWSTNRGIARRIRQYAQTGAGRR